MVIECQYDADDRGFWPVITHIDDQSALWSAILGDIVHNHRCALDHVTWAAMSLGCAKAGATLTPSQERRVQFPISDERNDFNQWISERLFHVSRAHVAIMRRYQPYHRATSKRPFHVLRTLNSLSNDDKHREVQLLDFMPSSGRFRVVEAVDCTVRSIQHRRVATQPFEVGAKLGLITVRKARKKDPQPRLEVDFQFTARPTLPNRVVVIDWLTQTRAYIASLLTDFGPPPADRLSEVGAALDTIDWSDTAHADRPLWART